MVSSDMIVASIPPQIKEKDYLLFWYYAGMPETETFSAVDDEAAKEYQEEFNRKYTASAQLYVKVLE